MAVNEVEIAKWERVLNEYVHRIRPPKEIRDQLDISYNIEQQTVIIHEIRPGFDDPTIKIYPEIAKAVFVKSRNNWKVYWLRADLRWHRYGPYPTVKNLTDFLKIIEEDQYGCFWG